MRDITQFCWVLFRYARRDTASGVKRFHWPSFKRAVEQRSLPDVSFTSFTTARADAPSSTVRDVAAYVVDVLEGQIKQAVDVEYLADTVERTLFNFAYARDARWASFLRPAVAGGRTSGWEVRMVVVLAAQTEEDPTAFPCIVVTVRLEGAVGCDQAAWVGLSADLIKDPAVTVDVMHCRVFKSIERLEASMYNSFSSRRLQSTGFFAHGDLVVPSTRDLARAYHATAASIISPRRMSMTSYKGDCPDLSNRPAQVVIDRPPRVVIDVPPHFESERVLPAAEFAPRFCMCIIS